MVVAIDTDEGLVGWGEMAPLGSFYSPAFAAGARAGIAELAPDLLERDPVQTSAINALLDRAMRDQPYIKSALDMACWDLKAKAARQPLSCRDRRPLRLGRPALPRDSARTRQRR